PGLAHVPDGASLGAGLGGGPGLPVQRVRARPLRLVVHPVPLLPVLMLATRSILRRTMRTWGMGFVIPRLLVVIALADVGVRALPVDPFTFRAWEALKRFRPPGAAFEPGRRYYNPRAYGDLAALGNLPELRQYRPETFTTDVLGFRNHGDPWTPAVAAILVGDSFAAGAGLDDDEDLGSGLGRCLGCRLYNAGGMDPDPDRIVALARRLGMWRGLVIHVHQEDFALPAVPTDWRRAYQRALASLDSPVGEAAGRVRGLVAVSPLKIVCERTLK